VSYELILGTAGHIDHGKTALVKALTGIDCDRLPEEKSRGITIDIGFASLQLGDFHLGIVDVPGHERFIRNMLAGATGIDLAMLVVAADDSVMPQTREHLEILELLGLTHGVIALTKADLIDSGTLEVVELEVRELVQGTFLENAPMIATSVHTGQGLDALRAALADVCGQLVASRGLTLGAAQAEPSPGWFCMAIDRSFVVQGHGTVATGSVASGSLRVGDDVVLLPRGEVSRARSLHHHDQPATEVHRGMRAAVNLAAVALGDVQRGQVLASPGYVLPSSALTVRLRCLTGAHKPLNHRAAVRFHVGTAEIMGRVSLLNANQLKAGEWGLAQLFLEDQAVTVWGQPFVVRNSSAKQTLGGGKVLQPWTRKIRRRHRAMLDRLERLTLADPEQRAGAAAWFVGLEGCQAADLVRGAGIAPDSAVQMLQSMIGRGDLVQIEVGRSRRLLLHKDVVADLDERILDAVGRMHTEAPLITMHDRAKVQAQLAYLGDDSFIHAAVERLLKQGRLIGDAKRIARADFKPKLSVNLRKLKDVVVAAYRAGAFQPPSPKQFEGQAGGNAASLMDLFEVCAAEGDLVHLAGDLYLHADVEKEMRQRVSTKLAGGVGASVAEIRDLLGTTRKYAVPFCEYLDRIALTRREGDLRFLVTQSEKPAASATSAPS
jgi:selenocysteine-specific elongation factor